MNGNFPQLPPQVGMILRGSGAPIPTLGAVSMWYLDTTTGKLYLYQSPTPLAEPWQLFETVNGSIYPTLTCYGNEPPDPNVGRTGDYYLSLLNVYGQASVSFIGPKTTNGWPS